MGRDAPPTSVSVILHLDLPNKNYILRMGLRYANPTYQTFLNISGVFMWKKLMFVGLLFHSMEIFAAPTPLLKADFISEYGPIDIPVYESSCTIYNNGKVVIYRHNTFSPVLDLPSPSEFAIQETRSLKLFNVNNIKQAVALAAKGTMHGNEGVNAVGLEYVAYQGSTSVILKGRNNLVNDSEWTNRLITVIDEWCGDISK
jgi:hypothetical protein